MWSPPLDWRYVVSRMRPDLREEYTARCEAWHAAHPPAPAPPPKPPPPESTVNVELFNKAFKKYGAVIPIPELYKIGYTKEQVAKVIARRKWYKDNDKKLQDYIEKHWPGGKTKKRKVIKAVNKRMPGGIENV